MRREQPTGMGHECLSAAEPSFARRDALVLSLAALLAIVGTVTGLTWASQHGALDAQQARISGLETRLQVAETTRSEQVEHNLLESLGVSQARLHDDAPAISRLVTTMFTWDSGQAYESAREDLKERFDLPENGPFLQQFMPPSRFNEDSSGKRYYYIDTQGMNSAVSEAPDVEVIKVSADQYRYAVMVDVAITSDAVAQNNASPERVKAHRAMLLFLTIDAAGTVSKLSGVPAGGPTRHSR